MWKLLSFKIKKKKLNTEEASLQTLVDRDINRKENGFVIKCGTACINWDQNPLYSFFGVNRIAIG
jgi:hypothetical protein